MCCEHKIEKGKCWAPGCNYCTHELKFNGICVACDYIDEKEFSEAQALEKQHADKLLKDKKLSLIVDLDKTILHATSVYEVLQWMQEQKRMHSSIVKDMITILDDMYTIKLRPGLQRFLKHMSRLYELHVYTMGRKCYAEAILDKIDPCRTLFQGRILTRDSNGSISRKRLDRIFPTDTSTVLVLDDCAEVWNDCPNLIHIKPYEYFMGVDEVNGIPSYNSQRYSSAKQNFLRLNHSALSLSFLKENEEYEENDNGDNAIMHLSDAESSDEDPSSLETMQDFSTPENVHFGSFGAYEGDDGFSVQSSPLKKDQENNDSFDSYFAKYFDLVIDNTIPKHPENDDILDNTRMILAYIHHIFFKEHNNGTKKPNVIDILNTLKHKASSTTSIGKEERSAKYDNHLLRKKRTHSELELESVSFKHVKSKVY